MQSILEKDNTVLSTVFQFLDGVSGNAKNKSNTADKEFLGGSISKYTRDLVMTFPVLSDTSLSPATMGMVSKANERNIVVMLQLLFGAMNVDAHGGREAIQKVHNNIRNSLDLDDVLNAMGESHTVSKENMIEGIRMSDTIREMTDYLKMHNMKSYPVNSFRETSLMNYRIMQDYYGRDVVREAAPDPFAWNKEQREQRKERREERREEREEEREKYEKRRDEMQMLPRVSTDQDYRKANELAPTLLVITFNEIDPAGNNLGKTSFAAGVKSRMIPVESSDIIERLAAKKNTALNFVNFIRATTGEIKFVKDFLFCVSQSKILAKNAAKKGPAAKMWAVLDARHIKNNKNIIQRSGNDASAITTLVINQETVNMIKKEYNFDVENIKVAKYIMNEYNLLGLVICDESIEVAKILYHGNDTFEANPYSFLNRENDNAKAYKDVINLVNQTRR